MLPLLFRSNTRSQQTKSAELTTTAAAAVLPGLFGFFFSIFYYSFLLFGWEKMLNQTGQIVSKRLGHFMLDTGKINPKRSPPHVYFILLSI